MDGAHTHGPSGGGDGVIIAAIVVIGAVFIAPIIMAILQAIAVIILTVAGIGIASGIGYLVYRVKHPRPVGYTQSHWRELPMTNHPKELPGDATHVTLTAEQYENLVRRIQS